MQIGPNTPSGLLERAARASTERRHPARVDAPCDHCKRSDVKVLRFNLMIAVIRPLAARGRSTRGAGVLYLCERCWKTGPGARMKPRG